MDGESDESIMVPDVDEEDEDSVLTKEAAEDVLTAKPANSSTI